MFSNSKEFVTWRGAQNAIILTIIVGLAIRFILIPYTSSPFDIAAGWVAINDGIYAGDTTYSSGWNFYPPIWGTLLTVVGSIADLFGMGSFGDVFTSIYVDKPLTPGFGFLTDAGYNILVKIPALIFDLLGCWATYLLVKRLTGDQKKAVIGVALWFLAPVVIMSSAVLNMFDSIMIVLMLFSLLTFMDRRYFLTGVLLSLAVFTKVFAILIIPVMLAYIISERDISISERTKNTLYAFGGFLLVALIVYLPTIISGEFSDSILFLTGREDSYSGFVDRPTYNNIFFYFPIAAVIYGAIFVIMLFRKTDREKVFLWLFILSIALLFSFPFVSYTPTYGITLLPAILLLYSLKGKIALIPWSLVILFPLHGVLHYGTTMFYSLAAFTGLIDITGITDYAGGLFYDYMALLMSTAGMALILIMIYYAVKKGEVSKWISTLKRSV